METRTGALVGCWVHLFRHLAAGVVAPVVRPVAATMAAAAMLAAVAVAVAVAVALASAMAMVAGKGEVAEAMVVMIGMAAKVVWVLGHYLMETGTGSQLSWLMRRCHCHFAAAAAETLVATSMAAAVVAEAAPPPAMAVVVVAALSADCCCRCRCFWCYHLKRCCVWDAGCRRCRRYSVRRVARTRPLAPLCHQACSDIE